MEISENIQKQTIASGIGVVIIDKCFLWCHAWMIFELAAQYDIINKKGKFWYFYKIKIVCQLDEQFIKRQKMQCNLFDVEIISFGSKL